MCVCAVGETARRLPKSSTVRDASNSQFSVEFLIVNTGRIAIKKMRPLYPCILTTESPLEHVLSVDIELLSVNARFLTMLLGINHRHFSCHAHVPLCYLVLESWPIMFV